MLGPTRSEFTILGPRYSIIRLVKLGGTVLKHAWSGWVVLLLFVVSCGKEDKLAKINELIAAGETREATQIYKAWAEESKNPNIQREYIRFLFDNKQYHDFVKEVRPYLSEHREDTAIRDLQFEYYALLARDAERVGNYETALDYIVTYLLSPDFAEYRKWESRQTTILRKWFQEAVDEGDETEQKNVVSKMLVLNFENLAETLAPEIYALLVRDQPPAEEPE